MKQLIFSNWGVFRVVRLVMGIAIIVQSFLFKDILLGIAGILFTAMALFNMGCCGVNGCSVPVQKKPESQKDISCEEVV